METWHNIEVALLIGREMMTCLLEGVVLRKLDKHIQKNEIDPYLIPLIKSNSKCIKVLNIRLETIKLFEEEIERKFLNNSLRNNFWR